MILTRAVSLTLFWLSENGDSRSGCMCSTLAGNSPTWFPGLLSVQKRMQVSKYSGRDQTVRFAHVTSLHVEGKQMHILRKLITLPEIANYEVLSLGNNVDTMGKYTSSPATPPILSIPTSLASNGSGTHGFIWTTVKYLFLLLDFNQKLERADTSTF
jgi:hypothetical protein